MKPATIYLTLSTLVLLPIFYFPVFFLQLDGDFFTVYLDGLIIYLKGIGIKWLNYHPYGSSIMFLCAYNIVTIFLYGNRKLQLIMGSLNYIFHLIVIIMFYFSTHDFTDGHKEILISYRGFYFPIVSLVFIFLANRYLKQEQKLIELFEDNGKQKAEVKRNN